MTDEPELRTRSTFLACGTHISIFAHNIPPPDHKNDIAICSRHMDGSHKRPCKHCCDGYTIIEQCREKCCEKSRAAIGVLQQQKIDQMMYHIDVSERYLNEYRSHLTRLKTESEKDIQEMEELPDHTAKVISDWKMKILSCYFRENQGKFFGKRGTSLLGFMVITNSITDPEDRQKGIKNVKFIMMVTDDSLQDEWSVMCAKAEIYRNHLPSSIENVWFQSDGAGCFSSMMNRVVQSYWQTWVGVTEKRFRISPRGGGKSQLDGMFAKSKCYKPFESVCSL
jgi:hypothetical protein